LESATPAHGQGPRAKKDEKGVVPSARSATTHIAKKEMEKGRRRSRPDVPSSAKPVMTITTNRVGAGEHYWPRISERA
jgi:hypothetical protein